MNPQPEDAELLRRYAQDRSNPAFAELVRRHINLVYASALRRVGGDGHLAKDVTQQVFVALAKAAPELTDRPVLAGWFHTTTRNQAAQIVRTERRRQAREQEAHKMNDPMSSDSPAATDWDRLRPVIDEALDELGERDREAVLLRYFEGRSFAEVGVAVGLTENAARMRVERAIERMHGLLSRRGVTSTVGALGLALSGEAAITAPAGLAATVTGAVLSGTAAAGGLTLLAFMNTTKIIAGVAAITAVVATGVAFKGIEANRRTQEELRLVQGQRDEALGRLQEMEKALTEQKARLQVAEDDTQALLAGIEKAKAAKEAQANTPLTAEAVQARFRKAQELVRAGNWEAALPELLWCYDEGMLRVEGLYGVRLSFLLSELGRLASRYPPALAALRERRDQAAKKMDTTNDSRVAAEFAALNGTLGEDSATLAMFDNLPAGDPRRQGLVGRVFDQLLAAQRYADAAAAIPFDQMTARFSQVTRDIPAPPNTPNAEQMRSGLRQMAVTSTAKNIEVLAGAGKLEQARTLTDKLVAYDGSSTTKLIIQEHLARAGHPELMAAPAR